jgi:hypothetical protein
MSAFHPEVQRVMRRLTILLLTMVANEDRLKPVATGWADVGTRGLDRAFGNLGMPKHWVRTVTLGAGWSLGDSAMMSARQRIPRP